MSKSTIVPCLWFDDQAEAAARFYTSTFQGGRTVAVSRYPESSDNPSGKPKGSVLTVEIEIAGRHFTLLNGGPQFQINPSVSFFVYVPDVAQADRLFGVLVAEGGEALMPLGEYPWSPRYGWVRDRFGVSWQVTTWAEAKEPIVPSLMFTGKQHGRAEEAMKLYTSVFPQARIERVQRYAAAEGPEGTVKHARFVLAGQEMIAMDAQGEHRFGFNEAVSLQVMCRDQAEVDRYWEALSAGGEKGPCGWLKDRFGLSWQVVPEQMLEWITTGDVAARDRAFQAMLDMGKLDVAVLQAAFNGT